MKFTDLWHWFGLSYSSYLVLPRVIVCDLPKEQQDKLLEVLEYIEENYKTDEMPGQYMVRAKDGGKFIKDPVGSYRHVDASKFRR
jgi:hypothetical protein